MPVFESDGRHVPADLKQFDTWVVWSPSRGKQVQAPWELGHMYDASWGAGASPRPETDFETARQFADLPPHALHQTHPFPTDDNGQPDLPDTILPTILLPHDPPEPPIMQVDFDDVRDPETGAVSEEVAGIVDRLDAYTEVSQSGEGLHTFVRAALPGDLGKFIGDLKTGGQIELYDHARVVGATWRHVPATPTSVPERQAVVDDLVREYEGSGQRRRRIASQRDGGDTTTGPRDHPDGPAIGADDSGPSPYFDAPIRRVADVGPFGRHRDNWRGPHPAHGGTSTRDSESTNTAVEPARDTWYCFAHDCGGRAIELAAVLCDACDTACSDLPSNGAKRGYLTDRPGECLRAALYLRDVAGVVSDDADPPHAALVGIVDEFDLHVRDREERRLGERNAELARKLYGRTTLDDLD